MIKSYWFYGTKMDIPCQFIGKLTLNCIYCLSTTNCSHWPIRHSSTFLLNEFVVIFVQFRTISGNLFLHSFDARTSDFDERSHRFDRKTTGRRAYFQPSETPAALVIDGAQDSDSGIYRCRVDFDRSPTRHYRVQMKIISKSLIELFLTHLKLEIKWANSYQSAICPMRVI